jgi:hypothetical protein
VVIALGFWSLALGYALIYTGVQFFTTPGGGGSLAANLGLKSALTTAPTAAATAATTAGTGGPSGTGYPSSTEAL